MKKTAGIIGCFVIAGVVLAFIVNPIVGILCAVGGPIGLFIGRFIGKK